MKNFRILLFVVAASLFAACDDAIDIKQPSELLPEDTFETIADLQLGLNGVYGAVGGESAILFTSIFTDEVRVGVANGGQGVGDGGLSFLLNSNSGSAESIWVNNYTVINFANRLILGSQNVEITEEEQGVFNDVIAQARALRAYAHIQLLTYFSTDMKDDNAPGVIAVDFVPTTDQKLPRNTNGEVYTLINSDLDFADANLISQSNPARTYISKDVITAIRARLAAYRGQYTEAEGYADLLIAKPTAYGLATFGTYNPANPVNTAANSNYYRVFRDLSVPAAQGEVIFKLDRVSSGSTGNFYQAWSSVNSSTSGGAFFEVSTALFNRLAENDVRRIVVVDPSSYLTGFTVRPVGKYAGSDNINLLNDVKVFRISEMYLIKAEAMASRGDFAGVAAQINRIRLARFTNATGRDIATPASAQEAWAAILNERRVELAFEGHRYIDIKRLGAFANAGIDRVNSECQQFDACSLNLTDHRWTLPVPRAELSANPNIQQNPGYNN
ncbi:hypothetical protein AMR72_06510 [Flavobacterium psychrophilum]|nr:hypothetical protein AMR72_06510 [Flavobacterium psychrophilum]AOE52194.1 hypothetical protein ALW18_06500 [Flavobacterium psychrophilum]